MKYDFHDDVRRALMFAREEALHLGHEYVGTEHLLLGLLRVVDSRAVRLLVEFGATTEEVQARVGAAVRRGSSTVTSVELPYTSRAKKVLEFAMTSARDLKHSHVDTEHLLVGLLREKKCMAAHVLASFGITAARVHVTLVSGVDPGATGDGRRGRAAWREPASAAAARVAAAPAGGPSFRIELDDRSDRSIYEQIVARVQEAVATGELTAGARLPAVRQLADQLDIAPGTAARAYGELERLGVVVTEGARGTHIAEPSGTSGGRAPDLDQIAGLLRPAAVAGFHMGAGADDMRSALEEAMKGIFSAG